MEGVESELRGWSELREWRGMEGVVSSLSGGCSAYTYMQLHISGRLSSILIQCCTIQCISGCLS